MIETQKYIRKPLYVDAVRITDANFDAVVSWCQGEVRQDDVPGRGKSKKYIKVRVHNPKNERQTKAFVGDWLLYAERGYKVYPNKAFDASFDLAMPFDEAVEKERLAQVERTLSASLNDSDSIGRVEEVEDEKEKWSATPSVEAQDMVLQNQAEHEARIKELQGERSVDLDTIEAPMPDLSPEEYADQILPSPSGDGLIGGYAEEINPDAIPGPVSEMAKAKALIEADGGTVEEATPQGIAEAVQETEAARMAEGKRVLSLEEQANMDSDEIRALLQSGEAVLAQDLVA